MTTGRTKQVTVRYGISDDTALCQCRVAVKNYNTVVATDRSFCHL